jgi:hypothetical protein
MKLSPFGTAALLILAMGALVSVASAIPVLPHAFCGDVVVNGAPAPDGTDVSATINEGTLIAGTQNPVTTVEGSFGKGDAPYLLVQGEIPDGAIVTFQINGVSTGTTAVFEAGGGPTAIQLSVVTDATPLPTQTSTPVSSGSSGGVETPTPAPTEVPEKTAAPGVTEPEEPVTHETSASTVATTPVTAGTSPPPAQTVDQTQTPKQAPLIYAPLALIAGGVLFIVWRGRR